MSSNVTTPGFSSGITDHTPKTQLYRMTKKFRKAFGNVFTSPGPVRATATVTPVTPIVMSPADANGKGGKNG